MEEASAVDTVGDVERVRVGTDRNWVEFDPETLSAIRGMFEEGETYSAWCRAHGFVATGTEFPNIEGALTQHRACPLPNPQPVEAPVDIRRLMDAVDPTVAMLSDTGREAMGDLLPDPRPTPVGRGIEVDAALSRVCEYLDEVEEFFEGEADDVVNHATGDPQGPALLLSDLRSITDHLRES